MAVAAVVLVAGACGDGSGDGDEGLRRLPVGAAGSSAAGGSSAALAAEGGVDEDAATSRMIAPFREVEYRVASGASDPPSKAQAYEVKTLPPDEVRSKIAKALRVDAGRVEVGVGGYDWYYSAVSPDSPVSSSSAVASAPSCAPDEKCIEPDRGDAIEPAAPPTTVVGVPTADEAEERVREFLAALGASDEGNFEVFGEDGFSRSVVFTPSIDGIPVLDLTTQMAFGENGRVEYASGLFAEVEAIGEYPLVGLAEAVERLQDGFGAGGGVATMGVEEDVAAPDAAEPATAVAEAEAERAKAAEVEAVEREATASEPNSGTGGTGSVEPSSGSGGGSTGSTGSGTSSGSAGQTTVDDPTATCAAGEPCTSPPSPPTEEPVPTEPVEPQVIEITGAELSVILVAAGCPGDPVYLVPAFDLQSADGSVGTVMAVEDDLVAGGGDGEGDDAELEPCPDQPATDLPAGKPEPAPEPANP